MRSPLIAFALCLVGATLALEAKAAPMDARIGVAGLPPFVSLAEAEIKLSALPVRLGSSAYYVLESYAQATGWVGLEVALSPTITLGGLAGLNMDWTRGATPAMVGAVENKALNAGRTGYLLGAYYHQEWNRFWLRLAPSLTLIPQDPIPPRPDQLEAGYAYRASEVNLWRSLLLGGPTWLEIGYKVTPNFHVSLQSNWLSFLKASWTL